MIKETKITKTTNLPVLEKLLCVSTGGNWLPSGVRVHIGGFVALLTTVPCDCNSYSIYEVFLFKNGNKIKVFFKVSKENKSKNTGE